MACYAALAPLLQLLEDIIHSGRYESLPLGRQTVAVMNSLHDKFSFFRGLLRESYGATTNAESQIRDLAHRVQHIIEFEMYAEMSLQVIQTPKRISRQFFQDIEAMEREIDSLTEEVSAMGQRSEDSTMLGGPSPGSGVAWKQYPIGRNTVVVGFDEYINSMKEYLCGHSSHLLTILIIGMAGIGKTTLAKNIFEDNLIVSHFDCCGWVTVSQDYHVHRVLQGLKKSLDIAIEVQTGEDEKALKLGIYQYLKGRRYCIVVDDIWNTGVWDDLRSLFPDDHNGSRVVLTSRLEDMAAYCGIPGYSLNIQILNQDESWILFKEKVFGREHCPPELEDTGKCIVKKCGGLPLAIVVIAGILIDAKTQQDWEKIAKNMSSVLSENDHGFSSILSLSYNHLPYQLKACLLYIGSFPEDYEIHISRLILLWISEGFLESQDGSKSLEKVGEECLQDLVRRSLVLVTKRNLCGKYKFCSMHDLMRDFCRQRAAHEKFLHPYNDIGYSERHRIILYDSSLNSLELETGKLVRCIISFGDASTDADPFGGMVRDIDAFVNFRLLRTLDLLGLVCSEFPQVVYQLLLLKYLALKLRTMYHTNLSQHFSSVQNLQTLIVACSVYMDSAVIYVPEKFWTMRQLRHLIIDNIMLPPVPHWVAAEGLSLNLLTLSLVQQFIFTKEAVRMICNLRKLNIECEGIPSGWSYYGLSNLTYLRQLEELSITFAFNRHVESLPANVAFPQKIKKLCLRGCKLPWECLRAVSSLPYLQMLKLRRDALVGERWEPEEGEFLSLKFLLMEELDLKYWQADNEHFPLLEHLLIRKCTYLEEIPLEIGDIPTLKSIDVYKSMNAGESAMQIQKLQLELENELQVRVRN